MHRCNIRLTVSKGRCPKLESCQPAMDAVGAQIHVIRESGIPLSTVQARALLVSDIFKQGYQRVLNPHLLSPYSDPNPSRFMATSTWISKWLSGMGYSWRAVTGDAGKVPDNWKDLGESMLKRMAAKITLFKIIPSMVVQADQTMVALQPAPEYTWGVTNAKNVQVVAKEDKAAATLMLASALDPSFHSCWSCQVRRTSHLRSTFAWAGKPEVPPSPTYLRDSEHSTSRR